MSRIIYVLCALTASLCAYLLIRGFRRSRASLLLWAGVCFVALALNNIILCVDRLLVPHTDLTVYRMAPALLGVAALLYGLVMEKD